MKLLVATQSTDKRIEIEDALNGSEAVLVYPADVGLPDFDVEETGKTFAENALLKARQFSQASGLSTLADDSGLEVRALGGAPGVYSKRFVPGSDADRNAHLLDRLRDEQDRFAEFVTVLCLFMVTEGKPRIEYFEGRVSGRIGFETKGKHGFGYDPLFIPDGYDKTFGELSLAEKQNLSHRGRALAELKKYLSKERQ